MAFELEKIAQSLDGSEASGFEMERIAAAVGESGGSSGGGGEIFVVNGSYTSGADAPAVTPDKTKSEIEDAFDHGKLCFLRLGKKNSDGYVIGYTIMPISIDSGILRAVETTVMGTNEIVVTSWGMYNGSTFTRTQASISM